MNEEDRQDGLDRTMAALADPTRRAILRRLATGEARVTDLAAPFAMSLNAVSKHIRVLERARLVQRRRVWREHLVSLETAPLDEAGAWIAATRAFWEARLDALQAVLEAEDRAEAPPPARAARRKKRPRQHGSQGQARRERGASDE
jgi:DNA-binding transcriptional ArsR family regulator